LEIYICKTLFLHRPDDFVDFTLNCPPHIFQQNCDHVLMNTHSCRFGTKFGKHWTR